MTGYLRTPAIYRDDIVFASDDDLWQVPATGGRAHRLTSGAGESSGPRFSPDGQLIAFAGREEGPPDVYAMPAAGGPARRLTYHGAVGTVVAGFDPGGDIIYATEAERPFRRDRWLYRISPAGGAPTQLPLGPASVVDYAPDGAVVLGRIIDDPARWKRYRGGRVGDIWIDPAGDGEFRRLVRLPGNVACPCVVGERVYFIGDHEGIGNVYSCAFDGSDLRRHSHHEDFYARGLSGDGQRLVYTSGARLWIVEDGTSREVDVRAVSGATQRARQFVPAARHLDTVALSPDAARLAITTRGKAYTFGHFTGPVRQHGEPDGVRYRLLAYLPDGQRLVAAAGDESDRESLVLLDAAGATPLDVDHGRATEIAVSPAADVVAVANHRCELLLVDLRGEQPAATVVDRAAHGRLTDLTWSPDGAHVAYTFPTAPTRSEIRVLTLDGLTVRPVTAPVLRDRAPAFDPAGRFLYFIGSRELDPVYDELQFEMGFPLGSQVYAVTLRADLAPPFQPPVEAPRVKPESPAPEPDPGPVSVEIDFAGIERRVAPVPLPDGVYERLGAGRDKLYVLSRPVVGVRRAQVLDDDRPIRRLQSVALPTGKVEDVADELTGFAAATDGTVLLLRAGDRLRVVPSGEKLSDSDDPGPESGWVDLGRVKVSVRPDLEWPQMFREAWRLQRDQFWAEDMSALDWAEIYQRYRPLVDRVATRSELSDLLWELQGELGTSHAYEAGGAYRATPQYAQGHLGVDWAHDAGTWRIGRVLDGDVWSATDSSPLARAGVDVRAGDEVLAIDGIPVGPDRSPGSLLVSQAEQEIEVTVRRGERVRTFRVTPLANEAPLRYRDFVDTNRAVVHERTGGRVGYLHIPNMIAWGYAEFHRAFLTEYDREALLVDVRWNGGGHVSGLLLQRLARKRIGYAWSRWHQPEPYPDQSPRGPMVMLTNEHAGSDGDIVSHSFKAMGLGPLIGRRTWGGVIGIWPRHKLADGTETTQPEFAFAFDDVGWGVENYGTDPDIEVDNRPQDYAKGFDAQLDRAIEEALAVLEAHPPHTPAQPPRPRFTRHRLP